jgi:uncharacterized protein YyaL (SSP411 family)
MGFTFRPRDRFHAVGQTTAAMAATRVFPVHPAQLYEALNPLPADKSRRFGIKRRKSIRAILQFYPSPTAGRILPMMKRSRIAVIVLGVAMIASSTFIFQLIKASEAGDPRPAVTPNEFQYTNRLINSKSPYLLLHAHNPVDWYPWGEEAFAKARKENKPIFLSVGYSTCHWCHVMAHESFENPQTAKIMNDNFVCIKVDREERPDVDGVYMTFVQATTGGGGWPMSVWLTPDLKPFHGGSYYPPEEFTALLEKIAAGWHTDNDKILASGDAMVSQLKQFTETSHPASQVPGKNLLDQAYGQIKSSYEPGYGGFGEAPKFPRPVALNFMLRYYTRTGTRDALDMSLFTLHKMADGGIHDQIGGGFHRYSTDNRWHVPHFEKMLYDQAQLADAYLDAYQITHDKFYADIARDILAHVRRDMTGDQGQFYSAVDADSPLPGKPSTHAEGAAYVWEEKETVMALGDTSAEIFNYYYGIKKGGNVDNDPRGEFPNKNVLTVSHTAEETAKKFDKSPDEIQVILADARQKLFAVRAQRPQPHLDDKVITAWNGLMISAYARAYQVLGDPQYLLAATKSAQFVKMKLYDTSTGKLIRRYRAGEATIDGFADDYGFFVQGLLDLYEASFDIDNLVWAFDLQKKQNELFWDKDQAGYFSTTGHDPNILLRLKEDYDGAEPSPNSVAAMNLLRLSQMLDDKPFREMADQTFSAFGQRLQETPGALPQMLVALDFSLREPKQIVIAGRPDAADTRAMLDAVHAQFIPNKVVLLADGGDGQAFLAKHLEFMQGVPAKNINATAYVCENYACHLPTTNVDVIAKLLASKNDQIP